MAGPVTSAAGLLLLVVCVYCVMPTDSVVIPSFCCTSFTSKKIAENKVISYRLSSGSVCSKAGVIFTTKKGHKFCGDPKQPWVQTYMKHLDARRKPLSPGPRTVGGKVPIRRHRGDSTAI